MIEVNTSSLEQGKRVARIEKNLLTGVKILPIIVECLQANYSLSDYGVFIEGYNQEMEGG